MYRLKIQKRILSIIFSACICSYAFAAIVSDNDGSTFVTKSEFESLKKDFANQIKSYNESIDNKIDGAIASYLAGINLEQKIILDSLLNNINDSCTDSYVSGDTKVKYGYRCMAKSYSTPSTQKPEGAIVNFFLANGLTGSTGTQWRGGGFARIGMNSGDSRTGLYDVDVPSATGRKNGKYVMFGKYNNKLYPVNSYDEMEYRYYATGSGAASMFTGFPTTDPTITTVTWTFPQFRITENYWCLKSGDASVVWDGGTGGSYDNIKIFYGGSYKTTENVNVMPNVGGITGSTLGLQKDNITKMRLQDDSYHWTFFPYNSFETWGYNSTSAKWEETIHIYNSQSDIETDFYFNCHPYETVTLSDLIDYDATVAYGDGNVALYGGLPLFKATNNGEVIMKIIFKSVSNNDVYIGLSTSQFGNDGTYSIQSDLGLRDASDVKYTSNKFRVNTEYTFVMDVKKDQVVWIRTYDSSSNTGFTGAVTSSIELVSD